MPTQLTTQTPAAPALDELMVCPDCYSWLINADLSALQAYLDGDELDARIDEIQAGERELMQAYASLHMGCALYDEEFSASACDCCGERLAGARHHMHAWQRRT